MNEIEIKEWIENNPHVALEWALNAHEKWYGCYCMLEYLLNNKEKILAEILQINEEKGR